MSTDVSPNVPNAKASELPVPLPEPSPVTGDEDYEGDSAKLLAYIAVIPSMFPHWQAFHPDLAKVIRGGRNVSDDFIMSVKDEVNGRPTLQSLNSFSSARAANLPRFANAFNPVTLKLIELAKGSAFSIALFRALTGKEALVTYDLTKGVSRMLSGTDAVAAAQNMGRALGRKRPKSRSKEVPPPATAPQSPQQ